MPPFANTSNGLLWWRTRFAQYGADGVIPKRRVITVALAWPTCGPQFVRDWLAREGLVIAAVTVWRVLRRHQLAMRLRRLAVLEQHSADTQGLLTERTARALCKTRHVEADVPGEVLSLDTFYVGQLKGVGKVWQITGCDVASSYTWAQLVIGDVTAEDTWRFISRPPATR